MSAKDQLMKITVKNPSIDLLPDETCYYQANAKLGIPHTEYTTTTKTKPGLGVGIRVTKHFGIGIGRQKVSTKVESQTVWDKTPCMFFMLDTRFVIRMRGKDEAIPYDDVTGLKVNRDALTISTKYSEYALFMGHSDVKRFTEVYKMIGEAAKEELQSEKSLPSHDDGAIASRDKRNVSEDFAKTIFLWSLGKKANPIKKRDEYAQYLFYEFKIQNAAKYHKSMVEEGYLEPASTEEMLDTLKVPELKEIAKEYGLPTAGKKANIIATIIDGVPQEAFKSLFPVTLYVLSDAGRDFLAEHEDYITLWQHRGWQISSDEYDTAKKPGEGVYDTCLRILKKRAAINDPPYEQRVAFYNVYTILKEMDRQQEALYYLLRCLYSDVNSLTSGHLRSYRQGYISKKDFLKNAAEEIYFAPGLLKDIGDLEEYYVDTLIELVYSDNNTLQLCPKILFQEIVQAIINGDFDEEYFKQQLAAAYRKA